MNKTKIELKNLIFFAYHGAIEEESQLGQRFKVDVLLCLVDGLSFEKDTTEQTVNYVQVYAVIRSVFKNFRFNLIERLAEVIASEILQKFDKVLEVTIRIKKPSVPLNCICDYFAVEITRCR